MRGRGCFLRRFSRVLGGAAPTLCNGGGRSADGGKGRMLRPGVNYATWRATVATAAVRRYVG
jgi:hypothetical protein